MLQCLWQHALFFDILSWILLMLLMLLLNVNFYAYAIIAIEFEWEIWHMRVN